MKKSIAITFAGILFAATSASAIEQCDEWFNKNNFGIAGTMGKSGTGVMLDKKGELEKVFASGFAFYQFDNAEEVADALSESALVAKANLAKYMKEEITSDESIEKISSKKLELTKNGSQKGVSAMKKTVRTQTMSIKSHSDALLTGAIKVCESNDAKKKEVQVVLAISPKTAAAASKVSETINKEIGSRKSVDEYEAERIVGDMGIESKSAIKSGEGVAEKVSEPVDTSFSNKAKNMNF